jgi:hypothetical protein
MSLGMIVASWIGISSGLHSGALASPSAYLDPGSGSYLLQLLIASALGGLVLIRMYWSRIVTFLRRILGKQPPDEDA